MKENIKNPAFVKTSASKQKSMVVNILGVILFSAFLFLNLFYSQFISPLYPKLVNDDKIATIIFLQKIKILPEYQKILKMNNDIYGNTVKKEIFAQENKKKEMINNLEQQLTINPKARDILYSLYKLYLAEDNNLQAQKYLQQVKIVDPGFISNIKY
ncbi:hypothetical protein HZA75_07495 [Candidatus Roizmanbacteria bacterium]|nr:hypothetical protein [Candidatus Roizmanbacteria bacterium]